MTSIMLERLYLRSIPHFGGCVKGADGMRRWVTDSGAHGPKVEWRGALFTGLGR